MIKSVAFYPEYLERPQWPPLFDKVKAGDIDAIRFGEFAWGMLEPEEGRFEWAVFDEAFDKAEQMGIKIILGTPTATPPMWLVDKYPDILPVNENGERVRFGGRQHRCYHSPRFRKYAAAVVEALAKRYGHRPGLFAWQIDNELAAEHKYCCCDTCRALFQSFLKDKYKTVDALNKRWMNVFWSQQYSDFSQIEPPRVNGAYLPVKPHPALLYEYMCFSSESTAAFCDAQYDILRAYSDRPITTNQDDFSMGDNTDWYRIFAKQDVVSFDIYTQNLYELGCYFDLARSVKHKPFWLMEFGSTLPILSPMLDLAHQKGCDLVGLFPFHPFPAGQEQGMHALVDLMGREENNYALFRDWTPPAPDSAPSEVFMRYDFRSSWAYAAAEYHTWEEGFVQRQARLTYQRYFIHTVYKCLFSNGISARFINDTELHEENEDSEAFDGRVCVLPRHIIYDPDMEAWLLRFMQNGGQVVATHDLFVKNEDNAYRTEPADLYIKIMGKEAAYAQPDTAHPVVGPYPYGRGGIRFVDADAGGDVWQMVLHGCLL